jgi:hypothetical protein
VKGSRAESDLLRTTQKLTSHMTNSGKMRMPLRQALAMAYSSLVPAIVVVAGVGVAAAGDDEVMKLLRLLMR